MKIEKIMALRSLVSIAEHATAQTLEEKHGARFEFRAGAYAVRLAGISGTSTMDRQHAVASWLRAARKHLARAEDECSGHVASHENPRVCGRCGIHIDELRPADDDPINLAGSGPVPIEPREG